MRTVVPQLLREHVESFATPEDAPLGALLSRIGDARVVLLGSACDGCAETTRLRARLTQLLVEQEGFSIVALEDDWWDAAALDDHVHDRAIRTALPMTPFARFSGFRWRNTDSAALFERLRDGRAAGAPPITVAGLDLLGTTTTTAVALERLEEIDPAIAERTRARLATGPLPPPVRTELALGPQAAREVLETPRALLRERLARVAEQKPALDDALLRAETALEAHHRALVASLPEAWNLRTDVMFATLRALLAAEGPTSRAVVWAHDAHVADARATETGARGHRTLGQLARETFGDAAFLLGMRPRRGRILAAREWGAPPEDVVLLPAPSGSCEATLGEVGLPAFLVPLRRRGGPSGREALVAPRIARFVGPVYRPERELASHYQLVSVAVAYDELAYFDESTALSPLRAAPTREPGDTHPFNA